MKCIITRTRTHHVRTAEGNIDRYGEFCEGGRDQLLVDLRAAKRNHQAAWKRGKSQALGFLLPYLFASVRNTRLKIIFPDEYVK